MCGTLGITYGDELLKPRYVPYKHSEYNSYDFSEKMFDPKINIRHDIVSTLEDAIHKQSK